MYLNVWIGSHSLLDRCLLKISILKSFPQDQLLCACVCSECLTYPPNNELSPVIVTLCSKDKVIILVQTM